MRKFKLIKEYPGSPKLGTIVMNGIIGVDKGNSNLSFDGSRRLKDIELPQKYPEFWQEMEELCVPIGSYFKTVSNIYKILSKTDDRVTFENAENVFYTFNYPIKEVNRLFRSQEFLTCEEPKAKDYEILSLICNENKGVLFYGDIVHLKGDFYKGITKDDVPVQFEKSKIFDLGKHWSIHSVKRLSDGEVFTVGDRITGKSKYNCIISSIELNPNYPQIMFNRLDEGIDLMNAKHIKQPLFRTEDGVDIFEGDKYYVVEKHTFYNHKEIIANKSTEFQNANWEINKHICLYFSTEEKAVEYVLMNKPCLSIKDVLSISITNLGSFGFQDYFEESLIKLVKEKQQ